jgi:hypothetical protein
MRFREYLLKLGSDEFPALSLSSLPGTPFSVKNRERERLTGMMEWAPRDVIERVGKGLREDQNTDLLTEQEARRGLPWNLVSGGAGGAAAGLLGGRLLGGAETMTPFKNILNKGISKETLEALKHLPTSMKALPAVGAGLGLLGGAANWGRGIPERRREAQEVSRGLLSEQILQNASLNSAKAALSKIPTETASTSIPVVVRSGETGD